MTVRLLVTASGGTLAPLNIRLLKESRRYSVWVAAVDQRADAGGRYFADAFAVVPNGNDPGYAEAIASLVRTHGIDIVLPWSDEEAIALASARPIIEEAGARLACASLEALRIMTDKGETFRILRDAGIRVPHWERLDSASDIKGAVDRFVAERGEFAVKPVSARGNRGTVVVDRDQIGAIRYRGSREWRSDFATFRSELMAEIEKDLPVLIMEKLEAPAYDIDVLASNGSLLRAVPRRRLNPAGIPFTGSIIEPSPELLALAARVTAALNLSWLYDYDLMSDREGHPVVIELNPRPSGSIAASIVAGVPFYEDLIAMARNEAPLEIRPPAQSCVVPYLDCRVVPARMALPY